MKMKGISFTLFIISSLLLILYGVYIDSTSKEILSYYDILGISLSCISSILGIFFVVCEVEKHSFMFVLSIISSCLRLCYLVFWSPLLWDIVLVIGYLLTSCYGLLYWRTKEEAKDFPIQSLSLILWLKILGIACCGIIFLFLLGQYIGYYSSRLQALSDAFTTVCSLLGQVLLSRKYIDVWYIWIAVNGVSIPLYISINSYTYAALFTCYLAISFYGLYTWKQSMME